MFDWLDDLLGMVDDIDLSSLTDFDPSDLTWTDFADDPWDLADPLGLDPMGLGAGPLDPGHVSGLVDDLGPSDWDLWDAGVGDYDAPAIDPYDPYAPEPGSQPASGNSLAKHLTSGAGQLGKLLSGLGGLGGPGAAGGVGGLGALALGLGGGGDLTRLPETVQASPIGGALPGMGSFGALPGMGAFAPIGAAPMQTDDMAAPTLALGPVSGMPSDRSPMAAPVPIAPMGEFTPYQMTLSGPTMAPQATPRNLLPGLQRLLMGA